MNKSSQLNLLFTLVKTDFKLRFYGSVLGYVWALLKPLSVFAVLYIVFSVFLRFDAPQYALQLLLGVIVWNFFVEVTSGGTSVLFKKSHLIRKVKFPRNLVVFAMAITGLIGFALNLIVFFLIAGMGNVLFSFNILYLILIVPILFAFALGIAFLLSVATVWYKDVAQVWDLVLNVGFFVCPIIYPIAVVPKEYLRAYLLNPLAGIIEFMRGILIFRYADFDGFAYLIIISLLVFLVGWFVFENLIDKVPERL